MRRGGGGGGATGTSGLSRTGLTLDTWKVGCTLMDRGSLSLTATGLMTFSMAKGPTNLGANLLDSTCRGRLRVESPPGIRELESDNGWLRRSTGLLPSGGRP